MVKSLSVRLVLSKTDTRNLLFDMLHPDLPAARRHAALRHDADLMGWGVARVGMDGFP
jgi:hypothetical protein